MKPKTHLLLATAITLFSFSTKIIAQAPGLGTVAGFVLYTTAGAVGNTGLSLVTGDIGAHVGAITGFGFPAVVTGSIFNANATTLQCGVDLLAAYNQLYNTAATSTTHTPAFGSGETLTAGVYEIAAAGSVAGDLTLNAQGNINAVFIFKFGGAFTTGAITTIHLINGALACNVFWAADGAISMAAGTTMKGTLIANNGAISMAAGGILDGRMFSTTGAVAIDGVVAALPIGCNLFILPVEPTTFTGICYNRQAQLNWRTTNERDSKYFTVERSAAGAGWQAISVVDAAGNSASGQAYNFTDQLPGSLLTYYRLKQTDINGGFKYSAVVVIKDCGAAAPGGLTAYPNPAAGVFVLQYSGDKSLVRSTEIFNTQGQKVYGVMGFPLNINLVNNARGMYIVYVHLDGETLKLKLVLVK